MTQHLRRWTSLLALVACVTFASAAQAEHIYRASSLHIDVKNPQGESLGHIEDFVVNTKTHDIVYAALAHGEVLGFGGKLYAVAPDALTLSKDGKYYVLDKSRKQMEDGKGFDANRWPSAPDSTFGGKVPATPVDAKQTDSLVRLSRVTGLAVRNGMGEDLGSVYDFGINTKDNRVEYAGISYGTTLGVGGKLFAVSCKSLMLQSQKLDPTRREFVLNIPKSEFEAAEGFRNDRWPETADARFNRK